MCRLPFTRKLPQSGMALIAVLWIVAALSVIVASMSRAARQEVRAVSSARQAVAGQALGLAAIQLVLQDMTSRSGRSQASTQVNTVFKDIEVRVKILPLTGLIDINNAPQALLAGLFVHAGGVQPRLAGDLAAAVAQARSARDARGRVIGFDATEDLLRVPGVDYTLYAKISALITADLTGSGRVSPAAAPPEVLAVLAAGNTSRAGIAAQQGAGQPGVDITALNGEFIDSNTYTQRFQLQARVPLPDGSWLMVSRTVDLSSGHNGLQWRVLHGDSRFEPAAAERI